MNLFIRKAHEQQIKFLSAIKLLKFQMKWCDHLRYQSINIWSEIQCPNQFVKCWKAPMMLKSLCPIKLQSSHPRQITSGSHLIAKLTDDLTSCFCSNQLPLWKKNSSSSFFLILILIEQLPQCQHQMNGKSFRPNTIQNGSKQTTEWIESKPPQNRCENERKTWRV